MWLQDVQSSFPLVFEGAEGNVLPGNDRGAEKGLISPSSDPAQVEEFEVATSGGVWVAIGGIGEGGRWLLGGHAEAGVT